MMDTFDRIDITELPLRVPSYRQKVEDFLGRNGLRLEEVDLYLAVLDAEGRILAGGGLYRDVIKCIAVSESARSEGYSVPLISRLISLAAERGRTNVKVFTKPGNRTVFESLGFHVLAEAPKAILMENGRGLEEYCRYLRSRRRDGVGGVIVMNANPFTFGHAMLVDAAKAQVDRPYVIPVKEDRSLFPYEDRVAMMKEHCGTDMVLEGSDYQISAATFPTYFLKDLSDAAETQMRLDIDLFGRHIAPALDIRRRFVGSEPSDPLTRRYNELMWEMLPKYGVQVTEMPRFQLDGCPVSATRVREALEAGNLSVAAEQTPASTHPYLMASLAERALRLELDAPLKPGLVCPDSAGAHRDMDYVLMLKSIAAIRPFFSRLARAGVTFADTGATTTGVAAEIRQLGLDAERAMLAATGGVNTHRGAIFALGLALAAAGRTFAGCPSDSDAHVAAGSSPAAAGRRMEVVDYKHDMQNRLVLFAQALSRNHLKDSELHSTPKYHGTEVVKQFGVKGAREMALGGYKDLFERWLPAFRSMQGDPMQIQKTLLYIMSELDDTCVIHRVGYDRAQEVKREARALLEEIPGQAGNEGEKEAEWLRHLKNMNDRYNAEGISPGGAADMLALTILTDSLMN